MKREKSFENWGKKQQRRNRKAKWKKFTKNRLRKEVIKQKEWFKEAHNRCRGHELKYIIMKFYNENPQIPENLKYWIYDNYQLLKAEIKQHDELWYCYQMEITDIVLSLHNYLPQSREELQETEQDYISESIRWEDIIKENPLNKLKDILDSLQKIDVEEIYRKIIQEFPEIEEYTQHKVLDY